MRGPPVYETSSVTVTLPSWLVSRPNTVGISATPEWLIGRVYSIPTLSLR